MSFLTTLDIAMDLGLSPKKVSPTRGGEYASPCPFCGGNDRFRVWPAQGDNGKFWCRGCGKGGDAIQLLIDAKGMSFKEAAAAVGKALTPRARVSTPVEPKRQADWTPKEASSPAELWQAKAVAFMEHCHRELMGNAEQLAWLAGRGITGETARRFKLGWNAERLSRKRTAWGLEVKKEVDRDGKEKLKEWICLSIGLVIPYFVDGHIHRLRIRKPEGEPRYIVVSGSGMAPMIIAPSYSLEKGRGAWIIVESELDAILIAQEAGDLVGAAALGSVAVKPDGELYGALREAGAALVALDADEAGQNGWPWWKEHFPQADRWIVPRGKDPGDYHKEGGDIRAWVIQGLPYGLRPVAKMAKSVPAEPETETKKAENQTEHQKNEGSFDLVAEDKGVKSKPLSFPANNISEKRKPGTTDEKLLPYVLVDYECPGCGKACSVCMPQGRRYTGTCFECIGKAKQEEAGRRGRRHDRA